MRASIHKISLILRTPQRGVDSKDEAATKVAKPRPSSPAASAAPQDEVWMKSSTYSRSSLRRQGSRVGNCIRLLQAPAFAGMSGVLLVGSHAALANAPHAQIAKEKMDRFFDQRERLKTGDVTLEERAESCLTGWRGAESYGVIDTDFEMGDSESKTQKKYIADGYKIISRIHTDSLGEYTNEYTFCHVQKNKNDLTIKISSTRFNSKGLVSSPSIRIWKYNAKN